jgi:hypothetical protein
MQHILTTVPTLAVASLYCLWNTYRHHVAARARLLGERVTYMLWVMATQPTD